MTKLTQEQIETITQLVMENEQEQLGKIINSPLLNEKSRVIKSELLNYVKSNFPTKSFADGYIKEAALMELGIASYISTILHEIHNVMKMGVVPYDLNSAEYVVESLIDARIDAYRYRILSCTRAVLKEIEADGGVHD